MKKTLLLLFSIALALTGCKYDDSSLWEEINAQNAYGQKLHKVVKDLDHFEQVVWTEHGEYVYTADRTKEHEILCLYLP